MCNEQVWPLAASSSRDRDQTSQWLQREGSAVDIQEGVLPLPRLKSPDVKYFAHFQLDLSC